MGKLLNYIEINRNNKINTKILTGKMVEELFKLFLKTYILNIANCYDFLSTWMEEG